MQIASEAERYRPVEPDGVCTCLAAIILQKITGPLGESDDLCGWTTGAYRSDNPCNGFYRIFLEFLLAENAGPGIENLNRIGAGIDLRHQIISGDIRKESEKFFHRDRLLVAE